MGWKDLDELGVLVVLDQKYQNMQAVILNFQLHRLFSLAFLEIFKIEYLSLLNDIYEGWSRYTKILFYNLNKSPVIRYHFKET